MKKPLVIYSGGLDTTVCIGLLKEQNVSEIHAVTVDVGQPEHDISQAKSRAEALGVVHHIVDAQEEFANRFCAPAIAFNADYFGYPLSTAIARPLIAEKAAEYAKARGPFDMVVHGCTGKGNDQFRIEYGLRKHLPDVKVYAPVRENNWTRSAEIEFAKNAGLPIGQSAEKIWSIDENLWGRSIEGGRLEDPFFEPPEEIFEWTSPIAFAPDHSESVEITFDKGKPAAIDGRELPLLQLIQESNALAGKHGVGRIDIMEDRLIGLKVRGNYECPGATMLIRAHKELEALVCTPHERRFKALVDAQWAELVYQGLWDDPLAEDLSAFCDSVQSRVSGVVRLKLFKGSLAITGRKSPLALYSEADASFDDASFLQNEMTGMVKAHGMAGLLYNRLRTGA